MAWYAEVAQSVHILSLRTKMQRSFFSSSRVAFSTGKVIYRAVAVKAMELHYFPLRGLGEQARLALTLSGSEWTELPVDYEQMKNDPVLFKFGQSPMYAFSNMHVHVMCDIRKYSY